MQPSTCCFWGQKDKPCPLLSGLVVTTLRDAERLRVSEPARDRASVHVRRTSRAVLAAERRKAVQLIVSLLTAPATKSKKKPANFIF